MSQKLINLTAQLPLSKVLGVLPQSVTSHGLNFNLKRLYEVQNEPTDYTTGMGDIYALTLAHAMSLTLINNIAESLKPKYQSYNINFIAIEAIHKMKSSLGESLDYDDYVGNICSKLDSKITEDKKELYIILDIVNHKVHYLSSDESSVDQPAIHGYHLEGSFKSEDIESKFLDMCHSFIESTDSNFCSERFTNQLLLMGASTSISIRPVLQCFDLFNNVLRSSANKICQAA